MKEHLEKRRRSFRGNHIIVSVLILVVTATVIVAMFLSLHHSVRRNILSVWESNTMQMARKTEYYLSRPADAVEFTALQLENLIRQGATNQEIGTLLVQEMGIYAPLVDNNFTGVYAYCRGEYLDASGWVPDSDYDATSRPWYTAAKRASGKTTYVSPFMNMQTKLMMMSVSKMLSDGESVVSMDIYLDGLQRIAEDVAADETVAAAFIIDLRGCVIARAGRDSSLSDAHAAALLNRVLLSPNDTHAAQSDGELVFAERIGSDWYAVLTLDEETLMSSLQYIYLTLGLLLVLTFLGWYVISFWIHRKYREAEQLTREVNAVADIYEAMTLIDLRTGRMEPLRSSPYMEELFAGDLTDYRGRARQMAERIASEQSRDMLVQFMNPDTYDERIRTVNSISHDFMDARGLWERVQLIVVDRESDGRLRHIIWAMESIDEEHRQQERLQRLAEMDTLSKVRNRRSGEAHVRKRLEAGQSGMFILVDVDCFKSINDTYGHKAGDLVIVALAERLRELFRSDDVVFRLGGDEFAVFVPEVSDGKTGAEIVRRIQTEVDGIVIPELKGGRISVSVGASYYPEDGDDTFDALYQRADHRMYENKRWRKQARQ